MLGKTEKERYTLGYPQDRRVFSKGPQDSPPGVKVAALERRQTRRCISEEPFQPFTYVNWQSGKPSHNDFGYCVYFWMDFDFESGYYWVDYSCSALYIDHICESV
ncbi:hypothetical protein OUZ56_030857 [Daphnia magna]|uniref:C-type lectin domain-containing protein n=1 Tax=Daphnia magna TaxID=35525 RepID=A0ABQ9ZSI0_9CRUS|nr:hypothetical protein OUZ56_030857 [Daphnia magna]